MAYWRGTGNVGDGPPAYSVSNDSNEEKRDVKCVKYIWVLTMFAQSDVWQLIECDLFLQKSLSEKSTPSAYFELDLYFSFTNDNFRL